MVQNDIYGVRIFWLNEPYHNHPLTRVWQAFDPATRKVWDERRQGDNEVGRQDEIAGLLHRAHLGWKMGGI